MFLLLLGINLIVAAECGDVDSDGRVDIVDALLTAQFYVKLIDELPGFQPTIFIFAPIDDFWGIPSAERILVSILLIKII